MKNLKYYIIFGILMLAGLISWAFKDKVGLDTINLEESYTINNTWKLPDDLEEVSGIAWIGNNSLACIQDEDGIIYIYNLKEKKVTNEIEFADSGDYEAIAVNNSDAYVMRSDGQIYEITNFQSSNKKVSSFKTDFKAKNNMETLTMDPKTNSLITAPKERDFNDDNFKGLYYIPLKNKRLVAKPFLKINMEDNAFNDFLKKKAYNTFNPSDAAIHPKTKDIYVLDGRRPKLVILDAKGTIKKVHLLDDDEFPQPEGITFSPDGTLYISNETDGNGATIVEVSLK